MPNKNFNQKTPEPRPSPGLQGNKGHTPAPDNTPDGTANWPTHGGVAGPMGRGATKVKQSAKTTV